MSELICDNPKGYSLTKGKAYPVIQESNNYVIITNDKGLAANYSRSLFTTPAPTPPPPPPPPELNITRNGNLVQVNYGDTQGSINLGSCQFYGSYMSCGIQELSGINDVISSIFDLELPPEETQQVIDEYFRIKFENAINGAIILASTNITDNEEVVNAFDTMLNNNSREVLNRIERLNPNSGNDIVLWTIAR